MQKNRLKIIAPVLIILAIVGLWFAKNNEKPKDFIYENQDKNYSINNITAVKVNLEGADFSLDATKQVDFNKFIGLPALIDYGSDSCIPCKAMAPALKKLNEEFAGKAFIKFADFKKYRGIERNVPINIIPSQVFFNADGSPFIPSYELAQEIPLIRKLDPNGNHIFTMHRGGLTEEDMRKILVEMGVKQCFMSGLYEFQRL